LIDLKSRLALILVVFFLPWIISSQSKPSYSVKILGVVQDGGLPHLGNNKTCCENIQQNKYVTSIMLVNNENNESYLFDASPDINEQLNFMGDRIKTDLKGIFLTHAHIGHYTGLMYFGREALNSKSINVYAMPRMKRFLEDNGPWSQLVELQNVNLNIIYPNKSLKLNKRLSIVPFQVPHRDEFSETVGFKIQGPKKNLIFIPDIDKWSRWGDDVLSIIKSNDFALLDGTFYDGEELPGRDMSEIPHPFIVESLDFFESIKDEVQIHFIHINHTNPVLDSSSKQYKEVLEKGFGVVKMDQRYEL